MTQSQITIPFDRFAAPVFRQWSKDWLLLTGGNYADLDFNMMTVDWGAYGVIWGKPFAMIMVRPQRHTLQFIEKYDSFTLTAFPESCRDALKFCGANSGRDYCNKAKAAGLTPVASQVVDAPTYQEAELTLECKKILATDLDPATILMPDAVDNFYPGKDFHKIYFGEVVNIRGVEKYQI